MKKTQTKKGEVASAGHILLTVIGAILCVILVPILIMNCTLIVKSYLHKDQVPTVGGMFPMIILTDSMYPEFSSGDLIFCHTKDVDQIETGDVICFFDPAGSGSTTVTHRVIEVTTDENGALAFQTKGDANNTEDAVLVPAENVLGVYQCHLSNMGNVAIFMQTTQGLVICVVCPILLLVIYDTVRHRVYEKKKQEDTDALLAELEALKAEKDKKD